MAEDPKKEGGEKLPTSLSPGTLAAHPRGFHGIQEAVAIQDKILASEDNEAKKNLRDALNKALSIETRSSEPGIVTTTTTTTTTTVTKTGADRSE